MPEFKKDTRGFRMKGWSPFTKKSPMKFVAFSYSSKTSSGLEPEKEKSSSGIKEQVYGTVDSKSAFNKNGKTDPPTGQDIVKSVKDQIKDLEQDIVKLKSRNNPGDQKRIQKLTQEIKRLKSK
tara:strand:+ start:840 stop:1208 length:369 start_codon:yes stop_codon:yes gene_type:complete